MKLLEAIAVISLLAGGFAALGAESTPGAPMKVDEPMRGEMKRETMKKGDVRKAAEDKKRKMKPTLDKESAEAARKK